MKILASFLFVLCLIGCESHSFNYQIKGEIIGPVTINDSLRLCIYDSIYNKNRVLDTHAVNKHKKFHFTGLMNNASLAFIILDHDSIPYYFQLDSIPINLKLGNNKFQIINGSNENKEYFSYLNKRQALISEKEIVNKQYKKFIADTLLTDSIEKVLKAKYYHLNDSLYKIKKSVLKKNNIISQIVKTRYGMEPSDRLK